MREICSARELRRRTTQSERLRDWRLVRAGVYAEGWSDITADDDAWADIVATTGLPTTREIRTLVEGLLATKRGRHRARVVT